MVKKCIVKYDEQGKPIELIELKEFSDVKTLKDFEELCKKNKMDFLKRKNESELKAAVEKENLMKKIEFLENKCEAALLGIAYLLGIKDSKDVRLLFEDYFDEKGDKHEQEN